MQVIINRIFKEAQNRFDKEFPDFIPPDEGWFGTPSWFRWTEIYYETAMNIRDEFIAEGLTQSTQEIERFLRDHWNFTKNDVSPRVLDLFKEKSFDYE